MNIIDSLKEIDMKEEIKKEAKPNEQSLADLPVANEQADETRGGAERKPKVEFEVLSWSFGSSNPST